MKTVNSARLLIKREQQRILQSKIALLSTRQVVLPRLGYNNNAITRSKRRREQKFKGSNVFERGNDLRIAGFPEISRRLFIRCYRKILVKFSTYPDPLQ